MALTVEDGTGLSTADSYLAEVDADTYHANYGNAEWATATSADKEVALRTATRYLDATFGQAWKGARINATMSLDWPRSGVNDGEYARESDSVPQEIKDATAILAFDALSEDIFPDLDAPAGSINFEDIQVGPIRLRNSYGGASPTKRYRLVEHMVATLTISTVEIARA